MIIETLIGGIAGGGLGGITGLFGAGLQLWGESAKRRHELEILRERNQQVIALKAADDAQQIKLAEMSAAAQERMADIQADVRVNELASSDYAASMASDKATYLDASAQQGSRVARWLMAIVDFLRGIIRPGATAYALALNGALLWWLFDMVERSRITLSADLTNRLVVEIIFGTTYLISTCVTWWFGVRPAARK